MDFVLEDEEQISRFPASSGLRQEACLVGYSEDNQEGDGIAEHFIHHKTRKDLELSAALGCHLCSLAANARWHLYAETILDDDDDEEQDNREDEEHREDSRKEPDAVAIDPTPPNVFDWIQATITPFDPDYTANPAIERLGPGFFIISGEKTSNENNVEVEELGDTEAEKSPRLGECQSIIKGKELKKLKSGI
jgi:hypothetical protein